MKKTYKTPTLLVVKLKTNALMLQTSGEYASSADGFARRSSFSEYDEEEE